MRSNLVQYKPTLICEKKKIVKIRLNFLNHQRRKETVIFIFLNHSEMKAFIQVVEDLFLTYFLY